MLFTKSSGSERQPRIWTIGHSTRKIDDFVSLLKENGIKLVADVRMFPGSKRYPQFGAEALARSLGEAGIRYEHFPELGGRRKDKTGFEEYGLAQRIVPRLRRLHGNGRVSQRCRATFRAG